MNGRSKEFLKKLRKKYRLGEFSSASSRVRRKSSSARTAKRSGRRVARRSSRGFGDILKLGRTEKSEIPDLFGGGLEADSNPEERRFRDRTRFAVNWSGVFQT